MIRKSWAAILIATAFGAAPAAIAADEPIGITTEIADPGALARLQHNAGLTLQRISWDYRGRLAVTEEGHLFHIKGEQKEKHGPGRLEIDGIVVKIDKDGFSYLGKIAIYNAPRDRKECLRDGTYQFRASGKRHYWRLQQMEACSGLTDYVDIYFKP
jgi:hypothetical protein